MIYSDLLAVLCLVDKLKGEFYFLLYVICYFKNFLSSFGGQRMYCFFTMKKKSRKFCQCCFRDRVWWGGERGLG